MARLRALVVDDFEDFQRFLCAMLQEKTECQVIGQASDGLDAVAKAEALQPDLILLDIGLPKLNGMEAARRIRELSPKSKILFVSQNSSPEMVEAAMRLGANGFLSKHDAWELPLAVAVVLQGMQFVSSSLEHAVHARAQGAPIAF